MGRKSRYYGYASEMNKKVVAKNATTICKEKTIKGRLQAFKEQAKEGK